MYITRKDLVDRFSQREIDRLEANIKNNVDNTDTDPVSTAINDAEDVINGYIAAQNDMPLLIIPSSVSRACSVLARYYLYKDKPTEQVRTDYEDAIRWLEQVSIGRIKLVLEAKQPKPFEDFSSGAFVV